MDKMNKNVAVKTFGQEKTGQKKNAKVFSRKKKSNKNRWLIVIFDTLNSGKYKIMIYWVVMPYSLVGTKFFGETAA